MVATDVADDGFVHLVAADPDGPRVDDAAERQDGDFRRAAADIDHHRAGRLGDRQASTDGCGHRLLDQPHLARAGALGGLLDGAAFHGSRTRRHADHDLGMGEGTTVVNLRDEMLDHRLGDFEIGDDAVAQRPDRLDVAGRAAEHHLGLFANREHLALAALRGQRDDRRLVQHDASALHINQRIGRSEVDPHVGRKEPDQTRQHCAKSL
jgi:hypothetical protein